MRHLIIGAGTVGFSTGKWLEANNEEVYFNDISAEKIKNLKEQGHKVANNIQTVKDVDITWICVAEWNVEDVVKLLGTLAMGYVVIRSTTAPGTVEELRRTYGLLEVAHNPEFLRADTAIEDTFFPDRIIIGSESSELIKVLKSLYDPMKVPIFVTDSTTSELIKLASNCWLATQISYWAEILKLCGKYGVNPQAVSYGCTLDKRISKYGSKLIGEPFEKFCLPKDIATMQNLFESKKITSKFLKMIVDKNEEVKNEG